MIVDAIEAPFLLIATLRSGKKRLVPGIGNSTSVQLLRIVKGEMKNVEMLDSAGRYFPSVRCVFSGIDSRPYLKGGLLGLFMLVIDVIFVVVLIKMRLEFQEGPLVVTLSEMKNKINNAIQNNPGIYTHAPVESILERVRSADNPGSLLLAISED
jgi:hypothetical protein